MLFESLRAGIPTVLTAFSKDMNIYENEYNFPSEKISLIDNFKQINDDSFYKKMISKQLKWSKELYEPFNEKNLLN